MNKKVFYLGLFVFIFLGFPSLVAFAQEAYQQEKSANNGFKNEAGLTGSLRVDQFSGSASYNLPLNIPAGRNGLNPSLNLFYNSHDRSVDSWVGQGWSLDFGYIQRSSKIGTNNLYETDQFTLNFGGNAREIVLVDEQNRLYASKEESDFLKIEYITASSSWKVLDKSGNKYYFGQDANSRQDDPGDEDRIFKWQLDRVEDTNGNFYRFEYYKNNGAIYPDSIVYTGNGGTDGPMEILFNLEARNDESISYVPQFAVTTDKRLDNIEIKVSATTTLKYVFDYTAGQNGNTSLLSSITKKGYQGGQEYTLPATTLTYQVKDEAWTDDTESWPNIPFFADDVLTGDHVPLILMDYNGDSWVDSSTGAMHNGNGWGGGQGWTFPQDNDLCKVLKNAAFGDLNGDKYPDIITCDPQRHYVDGNQPAYASIVYLNNKVNGFYHSEELTNALPDFLSGPGYFIFDYDAIELADINGDGLDDMVYARATRDHTGDWFMDRGVYLNTGSGWVEGYGDFPSYLAYCHPTNRDCQKITAIIVDVNGDTLPDVFTKITAHIDGVDLLPGVYLNNGSGWEQEASEEWTISDDYWNYGGTRITDLNGDGLVDIVSSYKENDQGQNNSIVRINTGSGWTVDNNWTIPLPMVNLLAMDN